MKRKIFCFSVLFMLLCGRAGVLYGAEQEGLVAEKENQTAASSEFYLGPEDILEISVWKDEAMTRQIVVRPDGKISFPLIGDILAQGRTVEELRQAVEDKLKVFVPDTPVSIMVIRVGSPKVFVVGKVAKPGVYIMGEAMTVMQVLSISGEITPYADDDDILIIRKENGSQKIFEFDYGEVASGKNLEQNIFLEAGDTVVVP